jgi:hypothetical protein
MHRRFAVTTAIMLCLALVAPALAQEPPPALDETTRNILCFGQHVRMHDRVFQNVVRIFVAPEPGPVDPNGMRLYVGFVESENTAGKRQVLYRGPLAHDWQRPRTPEALKGVPYDERPLRYHMDRLYRGPGGKPKSDTAEIDMEAKPPVVRYIQRDLGKPPREVVESLVPQPLTASTRLLLRSIAQNYGTDALTLRSLSVKAEGNDNSTPDTRGAAPKNPKYYMVSSRDGKQCAIHTMPARRSWWQERLLHAVSPKSRDGVFVVEILEGYEPPGNTDPMAVRDRRLRVTIGLKEMRSEVLDDWLSYDVENGIFYIP